MRRSPLRFAFPVAGGLALILGFLGFVQKTDSAYQSAILTLQLFVVNVPAKDLDCWPLALAGLLAPAATAGTVALAFKERLARRWRHLMLWIRPADEVFLGGGDLAGAILEQRGGRSKQNLIESGSGGRVIGLDLGVNGRLERAMRVGREITDLVDGHVFLGNAMDVAELRALNVSQAPKVWVLTGDDHQNLEIVRKIVALRAPSLNSRQAIIVRLKDHTLAWAEQARSPSRADPLSMPHVEYFSLPRLAARRLLLKHPPPYQSAVTGRRPLHICLVGDSEFTAQLLVHTALHCIYDERPERAVHVTLLARSASETIAAVHRAYPVLRADAHQDAGLNGLAPVARLAALEADARQLTASEWDVVKRRGPVDMVYLAEANDLSTFASARRLRAVMDASGDSNIELIALENDHGRYDSSTRPTWPPGVSSFDVFSRCFKASEGYPGADADEAARTVHAFYNRERVGSDPDAEAAQDLWQRETDDFRWSSRCCADHMAVKFAVAFPQPPIEAERQTILTNYLESAANVRALARLEHRRFVVERLLEGWVPMDQGGPPVDKARMTKLRLTPALVPFDALTFDEKAIDDELIRAMPACLRRQAEADVRDRDLGS